MYMDVSILPQTPLPSRLPHNTEQSSLCWLYILNIAVCACPSQTPELFLPPHSSPSSPTTISSFSKFDYCSIFSLILFSPVWATIKRICELPFACPRAKSLQLCPTCCNPRDRRLLCPWDSPGKNTGVGCHFLLQGTFLPQVSGLSHLCLPHGQADPWPLHYLGSV